MAYYDYPKDYGGNDKPETEIPESDYDVDAPYQFLCNGAGDDASCDFGYADWPTKGNGTAVLTMTGSTGLEPVTRGQAWSQGREIQSWKCPGAEVLTVPGTRGQAWSADVVQRISTLVPLMVATLLGNVVTPRC